MAHKMNLAYKIVSNFKNIVKVEELIRFAVQHTVLAYSCLLDNANIFEGQYAGLSFELYAVDGDERVRIDNSIHDNV